LKIEEGGGVDGVRENGKRGEFVRANFQGEEPYLIVGYFPFNC